MALYQNLMEHWFTVETDGTLTKDMELFKQLKIWNFDLIWKKMALYRKLLNFDLYEKK